MERESNPQAGERDDYRFLKLKDAMACVNQKVNLVGVLLEFGFPQKTKGTDFHCPLRIIDESYSKFGFLVNCFAENAEQLPVIASQGDIIQLSHVVMKTHEKGVYALFNKKFSSFALYDGKDTTDYTPYQVSEKFRKRESDKKFTADLQRWFTEFEVVPDDKVRYYIKDIKMNVRLNMTCKILNKHEVAKNEWIIYLWDGTDIPENSVESSLADEMNNPLPLQLEAEPLSRDLLSSFPSVGSILRVVLDEGIKHLGLGFLKAGQWVNFVNIICEVHSGLSRGVLMPFTKFRVAPNEFVSRCLRDYDDRFSTKHGHVPGYGFTLPSPIAEIDDVDVPFVTLMEVLFSSQVTAKFKCMVRVVAAIPCRAKDFLSPEGIYRIRLTLEDPTARVHAFVYAEDGETFFQGYPSHDILDKDDIWGTRCCRIFGTTLVGLD